MPALTINFGSAQFTVSAEDAFVIDALRKRRVTPVDLLLYIEASVRLLRGATRG